MLEKLNLSLEEIELLRELQRNEKYKKDYVKITSILMLNDGLSFEFVSRYLGIDISTVRRYMNSYVSLGLDKYLSSNYHINTGKLSRTKIFIEIRIVNKFTSTSRSICDYIEQEFNVIYTPEGLVPLLHKLGFSYKKTKLEP
ncbi:MAG: winged helix-turn-helix domain-containing protein [Candidatus Sericytochromatia bacterium]